MGRPKGSKNKTKLALSRDTPGADPFFRMTDSQVLGELHTRFEVMEKMAKGCISADIRGIIISGAPGIGKTFSVERALDLKVDEDPTFRHRMIKGALTPISLFKTLQDYQHPGNVVVLDDADNIFTDEVGVSILKAALDSSPDRWISWLSETSALKEKDREYEKDFMYNGTMVFITNTDFQGIVDAGKSKLAPHLEALMSRTIYLDLSVHHRRAIAIWVNYMVNRTNLLVNHFGLTKNQQQIAVDWIIDRKDEMRTLSLRDAMKLGQIMKSNPRDWEDTASVILLRNQYRR